MTGRRRPYTDRGITRVPCIKCGAPSVAQWHVCSDRKWYGVCDHHDKELNRIGLVWAFGPDRAEEIMQRYEGA